MDSNTNVVKGTFSGEIDLHNLLNILLNGICLYTQINTYHLYGNKRYPSERFYAFMLKHLWPRLFETALSKDISLTHENLKKDEWVKVAFSKMTCNLKSVKIWCIEDFMYMCMCVLCCVGVCVCVCECVCTLKDLPDSSIGWVQMFVGHWRKVQVWKVQRQRVL